MPPCSEGAELSKFFWLALAVMPRTVEMPVPPNIESPPSSGVATTLGAHCCASTMSLRFRASRNSFVRTE